MSLGDKLPEMIRLYFDERKTLSEVSKVIGCSDKSIEYHLKKNGYKLRSRSEALMGRVATDKMRETARRLGKLRIGENNPTWKGKVNRGKNGEYLAVRKPDHPFATKCGYVMEHRLVMEKLLGRYLSVDEDVHHINGNKKDNRIENLMVMKKSEHTRFHGNERIANKTHNNFIYTTESQVKDAILKGGTTIEMSERLKMDKVTFYRKLKRHNLQDWYKNWRKLNA